MEYPVYETNAGALIGVLVGQLDVDLPQTTGKRCWVCQLLCESEMGRFRRTLFWAFEPNIELLPMADQQRCEESATGRVVATAAVRTLRALLVTEATGGSE